MNHKSHLASRARGMASTAGMVADAGKYRALRPVSKDPVKADRLKRGQCTNCGGERDDEAIDKELRMCATCRTNAAAAKRGTGATVTLLAERIQQSEELTHALAAFAKRPGSKVLVVGVRGHNVQQGARDHDRVTLWESTELDRARNMPTIPHDVSVIMVARFCGHHVTQAITPVAKQRGIFLFSGLRQTGEIRKVLDALLDLKRNAAEERQIAEQEDAGVMIPAAVAPARPQLVEERRTPPQPRPELTGAPTRLEAGIDEATRLISESIAALTIVREELGSIKELAALQNEEGKKLAALRALLKDI